MGLGLIGVVLMFILAYFIVVRIGALALQLTGIEADVARFQALSALTGTGFTTTEAERVVRHRTRRRIISTLIIVGNAGLITIIGTLIVSFVQVTGWGGLFIRLGILVAGIFVLYRLIVASGVGNRIISWCIRPLMKRALRNAPEVEEIFSIEKGWAVNLVSMKKGSRGIGLSVADVSASNVAQVLSIDRGYISITQPVGAEKILEGDRLLVYGDAKLLRGVLL